MLQELFFQGSTCLDEEAAVNHFVRHLTRLIARIPVFEPAGDLLRRLLLLQLTGNQARQDAVTG